MCGNQIASLRVIPVGFVSRETHANEYLQLLEKRRIEGARVLKRGVSQAEVARLLDVSRQSVSVWQSSWPARWSGRQAQG
jgi:DNA-binding transcriptional regulator YiaG